MIIEMYRRDGVRGNRYVKRSSLQKGTYSWCIQDALDRRFDVAQGTCTAEDLPDDIRKICDEYQGYFYACEWPYENP